MDMHSEEKHEQNPHVREARQHARAAREEFSRAVEGLLPPHFAEHRRAAQREWLMAVRSMVNAALERIDRAESETRTPPQA
ncbi:MAG TPA: hypothetical protein VF813_05395 [Anaerolineaceae bacterium]